MAAVTETDVPETFAELLDRIGHVPPERIRLRPPPGTATEKDVITALEAADKRLYELVDGVLVEKDMGTREAILASVVGYLLWQYLEEHDRGIVAGADGAVRLGFRLVRIPDVSFIPWDRLPNEELPDEAILSVAPALAVEVLSESNTKAEMMRKLKDYFGAGVQLVWMIDPKTETAMAYTSATRGRSIGKNGVLEGGKVLPGFTLSLKDLFARTRRRKRRSS
jgi:Uma2 family endonuclease